MTTAKNEVFISSIVKWGYQDNFSNLYFLRKDSERKKARESETNYFHPLRSFCARENLSPLWFFVRLFLFC